MSPSDSVAGSAPEIRRNRHRRHCRSLTASSFSSSNSSSSLSTFSSSTPSPCSSASAASASTVPFSWEHRPGIPKHPKTSLPSAARPVLLLRPPPLRYRPDVRRRAAADPFALALAECAKGLPEGDDADGSRDDGRAVVARRSRVAAIADWLSLLDLSGSCKAAGAVADAVVRIPRPRS